MDFIILVIAIIGTVIFRKINRSNNCTDDFHTYGAGDGSGTDGSDFILWD